MGLSRRNEQSHQTPENQGEGADTKMQEAERSHVEELTTAFQESWDENHQEGDPKVSFKIFFAAHGVAEDAHPDLRDELLNTDIYMPEAVRWTLDLMKEFNDASRGEAAAYEHPNEKTRALLDALHGTGVEVVFPDLPMGHEISEQSIRILGERRQVLSLPFDEAVQRFDESMHAFAMVVRAREEEIMKNIPIIIRKVLEQNETLQNKDSLKVLLTYGNAHTALYHALSATESDVSKDMGGKVQYEHFSEQIRRYIFGVADSDRNADLPAYGLVGYAFRTSLKRQLRVLSATTDEIDRVSRLLLDPLTLNDLSDVWSAYLNEQTSAAVLSAVEEKGFVVPKTRAELDELLQSKRKS